MLNVTVDNDQINRLKNALEGINRTVAQELALAINTTSKFVVREISKVVREELLVPHKAIVKTLKIRKRARKDSLSSVIQLLKSWRIGLRDFGARPTAKGISYKISRTQGRKILLGAFHVKRFGNHVFKRVGKERLPIFKPRGPSPWGVFVTKNQEARINELASAELIKQIEKRIRFRTLKKAGTI